MSTLLRESQRAAQVGLGEANEMVQSKSLAGAKQFPRKEHHHKQLLQHKLQHQQRRDDFRDAGEAMLILHHSAEQLEHTKTNSMLPPKTQT